MRLLILSNLFPPYTLGGYEIQCSEVVAELTKKGHDVHVLTSQYGVDQKRIEGNVRRVLFLETDKDYYKPFDFLFNYSLREQSNLKELSTAIDEISPDAVVIWGMWHLTKKLPYLAEQMMPGRVAYYIMDHWPSASEVHFSYWNSKANHRITELIKKPLRIIANRQVSKLSNINLKFKNAVCCSSSLRRELVNNGSIPVSTGILHGGIDPHAFTCLTRSEFLGERIRLLYFGSLLPIKGVDKAIEALSQLKNDDFYKYIDLTLIGGGHPEYIKYLKNLSDQLGVCDKINFYGQVAREELLKLLEQFNIFLFTSVFDEPFGLTVLEAMVAGLLVIGSEVGGQIDILKDGVNALTYQPGDVSGLAAKIRYAINHPDVMTDIANTGRDCVLQNFTIDRMINDFEKWLQEII